MTAEERHNLAAARKRPIDFSEIPDLVELQRQGRLRRITRAEWHRRAKASPLK